jgi:ubiquinone/menaquinone biosynthesis C-methylase UbiE
MKESRKFDPKSIDKLNNPERFNRENPDLIWKELALAGPRVLIEIGAGTGFFAAPFAREMKSGTVYACDVQDEMLSWMKEHLPSDLQNRLIPLKMEETSVPLPGGIADLVYMINLHHELEDRQAIMQEAFRLLKPGGSVMVMDWKKEETPAGPPVEIRVSEDEIVRDVEKAGFKDMKKHPVLRYHNIVTAKKP